jgi:hypothetical protein
VAAIRTTEVGYQQNHRRAEMALSAGKHLPEHVIALEARRGESGAASSRPAHPFAHRFLRLPIALSVPSGPLWPFAQRRAHSSGIAVFTATLPSVAGLPIRTKS